MYLFSKKPSLENTSFATVEVVPPAPYSMKPRRKSISPSLPVTNKVKKHKEIVKTYLVKKKLRVFLTNLLSIN